MERVAAVGKVEKRVHEGRLTCGPENGFEEIANPMICPAKSDSHNLES
jgi:hypothetical protein